MKKKGFQTRAIHIGNDPDISTGAVTPPIHFSSTFKQDSVGVHQGFDYSRAGNPTRKRFENNIASLEGARFGVSFASGMAAITALFQTLNNGDHVIIGRNVYGGTYRMAVEVLTNHGFEFDFVDTRSIQKIKSAIKTNTKWIFAETPTNPLLELCDIQAISDLCLDNNIKLAIDNTFMSPYGQNPLKLGADVVMHSATKFIGGHSDLVAGVLITNNSSLAEQLYFIQKSGGAILSPFDCWMLLRSTKTLGLRVQKHSDNAMEIAKMLQDSSNAKVVVYPGLDNHSQHALASKQQKNPKGESIYGSMVSFECNSLQSRDKFLSKIKLFTLAESLGGVESLICVPYDMTHASVPQDLKNSMGLSQELLRLSVGIEDSEDLIVDIAQALEE
ncbi:MAG: cystathionine gamma-synthase [Candidatus Marinimicrobia bacterium]|nr:cystathionine gamma-synthase [Candidatus Neomarinimicrobiota bacterium]|tara:strand:+ start:10942 stop:12105 length:1164 start_codon:yes stop_codon:yes gene_type:complete